MVLRFSFDGSAADWLTETRPPGLSWERSADRDLAGAWAGELCTTGPRGFAAYARLRFLPDPTGSGQAEAYADDSDERHRGCVPLMQRAVRLLADHTSTPESAWISVWDGWPHDEWRAAGKQTAWEIPYGTGSPYRAFYLLHGTLADFDGWARDLGVEAYYWPGYIWPEDHRWCLTCDVDPHWAVVGASAEAVGALLADDGLDAVPFTPGERPPEYDE